MGETRGLIVCVAWLITGCATSSPPDQAMPCPSPTSVEHALSLQASSCSTPLVQLLKQLDDGSDQSQYTLALALEQAGEYSHAADWYRHADTEDSYQRLLALYGPDGPLEDDADYLRSAVQFAQFQQRFGQPVEMPAPGQAEPLYVQSGSVYLLATPDESSPILDVLEADERVFLLDVSLVEQSGEYWAEVYYQPTLQLGWIPVDNLAQTTSRVRHELAFFNAVPESVYSQQALFAATIAVMDLTPLTPLGDGDFFRGAGIQQRNAQALLRALGDTTDYCEVERNNLQQALGHYLMDEGPRPSAAWYPQLEAMLNALSQPSMQLREDAYEYFRIRLGGGVNQRLCHSIPHAADQSELAEPACQTLQQFNQCLGQVEAAFRYLAN